MPLPTENEQKVDKTVRIQRFLFSESQEHDNKADTEKIAGIRESQWKSAACFSKKGKEILRLILISLCVAKRVMCEILFFAIIIRI